MERFRTVLVVGIVLAHDLNRILEGCQAPNNYNSIVVDSTEVLSYTYRYSYEYGSSVHSPIPCCAYRAWLFELHVVFFKPFKR